MGTPTLSNETIQGIGFENSSNSVNNKETNATNPVVHHCFVGPG
jgi:hypothetical protein